MTEPAEAVPARPPSPVVNESTARRGILVDAGVGLVAAFLALAPLWAGPTRRAAGDWQAVDTLASHQALQWVAQRMADLQGFAQSAAVYAPVGDQVFASAGGVSPAFAAPFLVVLGWPLGLNVYLTIVLAANVVAGAAFARALGAGRATALVGGLAYGLSPYFLGEISAGRFAQVPGWELAGGLAFWLRHLLRPSRRSGVGATALLGLAGLEYGWYGVFGVGAALALAAAAFLGGGRDRAWKKEIGAWSGAIVVALVPGLALAFGGRPSAAHPSVPDPVAIEYSLPPAWPFGLEGGPAVPAALPLVVLALAAVALLRRGDGTRWAARGTAVVALVAWTLSLGPRMLTTSGPISDSHFPFYVVYSLLAPRMLYPYQHAVLVTLVVSGLAARALQSFVAPGATRRAALLAAVVAVAMPVELVERGLPVQPLTSHLASDPAWLDQLRALPEGAVLGLPLTPELRVSQEALLLQTRHNHPIVDGPSMWRDDRRPAGWDDFVTDSGLLTELERFERGKEDSADPTRANYFRYPAEDPARLVEKGVRWVMVWDALYPDSLKGLARGERELFRRLCGNPVLTADGVTVYDLGAHQGSGELLAPLWRMPSTVKPGDGLHRMAGRWPKGALFERVP